MSDMWSAATGIAAARLGDFARDANPTSFTPWATSRSAAPRVIEPMVRHAAAPEPVEDMATIEAEAFAAGFAEGRRTVEMEFAAERDAILRLAETLEVLRPEPHHELGLLLAETVERLVRQIVGEVTLDNDIILARANAAAELIAEESTPARMRLSPDDFERLQGADLPVQMVADENIVPGMVLVETGEGWIEDGPEVGLEKLRIALDKMGVPR
ncbi:hypothetical protein ACFB49_34620 [Sphingomonas sp. DBB INV C78]|uniref:FliH/SctL family protein n=1 Tax=Sphingomonas sp. DBB INV C78 TaxID=3349434 RepID=UPI0036D36022